MNAFLLGHGVEGFRVKSHQANFACHHTRDRHVGFLSIRIGIGKQNKMSQNFLYFSSYHNNKLQLSDKNISTHTQLQYLFLPRSKSNVPAVFVWDVWGCCCCFVFFFVFVFVFVFVFCFCFCFCFVLFLLCFVFVLFFSKPYYAKRKPNGVAKSSIGLVHLTHQYFCHNSLAKVKTQLLIFIFFPIYFVTIS